MAHYQNIYNGGNGAPPVAQVAPRMTDWSGEVTPMPADPPMPEAPGRTVTSAGRPMDRLNAAEEQGGQSMGSLDMRNHLPSEVITDPISMEEAYRGSLKAMLKKNVSTTWWPPSWWAPRAPPPGRGFCTMWATTI